MKAFNEKCDKILCFLKENGVANHKELFIATGIELNDAIVSFLINVKGFVENENGKIYLTQKGKDFISTTSFVEQRDKVTN